MAHKVPEMNEKALLRVARLLQPKFTWETQKRFYYHPDNKKRFYQADCVSVDGKIIIEYEGPNHYRDIWKGKRDEEREKFFVLEGYSFKRWPYYCQLNREVARHYFGQFSEESFIACLRDVYKTSSEKEALACGFHNTPHTPSNFTYLGVDRFLTELDELPAVVADQVAESLRRYCQYIGNPDLVLGRDKRLHELLSLKRVPELSSLYKKLK